MADMHSDDMTVKNALTESGAQGGGKKERFVTKDVVMCVAVLAVIALVAGVLLGLVNWLTYVDPDQAIRERLAGYYNVGADAVVTYTNGITEGSSYVAAAYVVETADGEKYVCHAVGNGAKGGTLELLVHFSDDGVITEIEVYAQSETAGYMDRVLKANKSKYVGKNVLETGVFDLVKGEDAVIDDGDVDAVTQATFTSRGVNNAVNAAIISFERYYTAEAEI